MYKIFIETDVSTSEFTVENSLIDVLHKTAANKEAFFAFGNETQQAIYQISKIVSITETKVDA